MKLISFGKVVGVVILFGKLVFVFSFVRIYVEILFVDVYGIC